MGLSYLIVFSNKHINHLKCIRLIQSKLAFNIIYLFFCPFPLMKGTKIQVNSCSSPACPPSPPSVAKGLPTAQRFFARPSLHFARSYYNLLFYRSLYHILYSVLFFTGCGGPAKRRGQPLALCGWSFVLPRIFLVRFSLQWRKMNNNIRLAYIQFKFCIYCY